MNKQENDYATLLYQLHLSYKHARKNKRNTQNQLAFELNQEEELFKLATQIQNRTYRPKPSIAFIVYKPVQREIFAADFSDRVVHHLIYRSIYHYIDKQLINDAYSCRKNKGTLYGINRVDKFMRSCTHNYTKDAYVLKLDIEGYFMNMNHQIIYDKIIELLPSNKTSFLGIKRETLYFLLKQTIFNDVVTNCRIKGSKNDWKGLPPSKSLFNKPEGVGLPIGNLTSQVFGNVYLNGLDHYVKKGLKIKHYGRYVDDMVFIHENNRFLTNLVPKIQSHLNSVGMNLHPRKITLQHYSKGVMFLGQYIKPHRKYISNRTKNNFYNAISRVNKMLEEKQRLTWKETKQIQALLNSYLGILKHANTFLLRKKMLDKLTKRFYDFYYITKKLSKVIIKKYFWEWHCLPTYQYIN